MNKFVDAILDVMEKNAGNRKISFSSFDPQIITALKLKKIDGLRFSYSKKREKKVLMIWSKKLGHILNLIKNKS